MRGIQEELEEIIVNKRIRPVFQPIVSLRDGSVIGYEALSRITGDSIITNPEELFCMAEVYNKIWELEQLCRKKTLKAVFCDKEKQFDKKLFLNVNPLVMHDVKFQVGFTKEYLERYGIQPSQVVIEITERGVIKDNKSFQEAVAHYKKQQYEIAIDDAGSCYAGLNLICDIVPSYLKLDMNLIRGIHKQPIRYAMVKSMAELCKVTGIILIAEGIETKEELKTLIDIGVDCGQGYMLGKPETERIEPNKQSVSLIKKYNV